MRKPLMMGFFCIVIVSMALFAGCIQTEANTVDGIMFNNTDSNAYVHFNNKDTGDHVDLEVVANSTRSIQMRVGRYDLKAYYTDGKEYIDSAEMLVEASDSEVTIIIYNTSLYAVSI